MGGELTKLSETRWRYATGKRVYYVRQRKAPNEDLNEPGLYMVDTGRGNVYLVKAESAEQVASDLRQAPLSPGDDSAPW